MAKKKNLVVELAKDNDGQPGEVIESPVIAIKSTPEDIKTQSPALVIEPATASDPAPVSNKVVKVRNQGAPFACDLTAYGYGMRWPTNAVYSIPTSKYIELLQQGLDGVSA